MIVGSVDRMVYSQGSQHMAKSNIILNDDTK